jgi:hypothetical protein
MPLLVGVALMTGLRAVVTRQGPPPPLRTDAAPWPLPDHQGRRIGAAGLPSYRQDSRVNHIHAHLDISVNGQPVAIPAGLGLAAPHSAVHTHSGSGLLHVESDDRSAVVTLGQLFTVWGVRLTETCLGGYCGPLASPRLYVDGQRHAGSISQLTLADGVQITLVVGEDPAVLPSTYDCHNAADIEADSCRRSFS